MNNLKKVLALGLALIMLFGMFTVVSAAEDQKVASDLTDWNTVSHKDAVGLMVDLGIIKGMPDGSFNPTGNIDRASWAKMVYFAATGSEDADAFLGTNTGLNDIAGNWAESYISFLKANQYISGDNYGNYNPSANVTVAEACKMMLTVLGYDAEDRGYQNNTAWSGNIMTDAKRNGLMDNVDKTMTALTPLTRENAAEIVMNALNANTVISESRRDNGESYVVSYTKSSTLGYDVFNLVKVTVPVTGIDDKGFAEFGAIIEPQGFSAALGSKVKATADMAGETVNVYVTAEGFKWDEKTGEINKVGTFKTVVSTAAAKTDVSAYKVVTGGLALADATSRTSTSYVAPKYADDCEYYLNGKAVNSSDLTTKNIGQRGTVVEFYLNDEGLISTVKAYYYTVDKVEGAVTTKTLNDGTVQVKIPGVLNSFTDADKVSGWQGLEDGDVVLYYETTLTGSSAKAYTFEKAEKINGKVTTYSGAGSLGSITVGGKNYRYSAQDVKFTDASISNEIFKAWTTNYSLADEFNFWLDKNGDIAVAEQVTETMDASKVCLVIETEEVSGSLGTSGSLAANLLFVDGSTEIVNVSKVATAGGDLLSVVDKKSTNESTAAKQILAKDAKKAIAGNNDADALKKFFNYRVTSAGYELTELCAALNGGRNWEDVVVASASSTPITKTSDFAENFALSANATTTFIIGKVDSVDNSVTYSVAKSYKNIHEMDATRVTGIAVNTDPSDTDAVNTMAKYVYLEAGSFKDDAPDGYIFITGNGWKADPELYEDDVFLVNIVDTDGSTGTMRVTGDLLKSISGESTALSGTTSTIFKFWAIKLIDENKVVSALGDENGNMAELKDVQAMGDDVVKVGGKSYSYDSATKFIYVDMDWADDEEDASNISGVREPNKDKWVLAESGTFEPQNWFNAADVDATGKDSSKVDDQNPNGATYISVQASVIERVSDKTYADYVYVVRYLW